MAFLAYARCYRTLRHWLPRCKAGKLPSTYPNLLLGAPFKSKSVRHLVLTMSKRLAEEVIFVYGCRLAPS